jgi:hypothetical protein
VGKLLSGERSSGNRKEAEWNGDKEVKQIRSLIGKGIKLRRVRGSTGQQEWGVATSTVEEL